MSGGFVIVEYDKVRQEFPNFNTLLKNLKTNLTQKAQEDWGLKAGGIWAPAGSFSESTIIPALFNNMQGARLVTWDQWFNAVGAQTVLTGSAPNGTIWEDYKIGLAGFQFPLDAALRISEIRMQISEKNCARINIEEMMGYEKPAVIFEDAYILDEETGFQLLAFVLSQGPQAIKPIGLQLNRIPNKLQVTNTGAVLA